ncbi:MAG: hypothetical protein HXS41_12295 [Theionarchaea archaeon]|nr:hypothetical protein [Theionarchaea archaeon]MBU7021832.1 hypothetical protein [Theionarchaea archaeon]MBU7034163.1 hypothetical protein [Theionarchaea archaeon]MBU7040001.1 hypothetical protein [Theionarchaea archaeon]
MVNFARLPFFLNAEGTPAFVIVVGENCPSLDIVFASSIATKVGFSSGELADIRIVDIVKFDEEVTEEDKKQLNLILIGTSETNTLIREISESGVHPHLEVGNPEDSDGSHYMFFKDPYGYGTHVLVIIRFAVMETAPP